MDKKVLKGTRWLLLKRPENLDPNRREAERLAEALRLNEPLAMAYYLKEDLRQIWEQDDQATAAAFLLDWIDRATASGIRMLHKFAKTLRLHAGASWPTTTTRSPPAPWKAPTTRSKP